MSAEEARALLRESPGILLIDRREEEDGYEDADRRCWRDGPPVSCRVRDDPTIENGLAMWIVADDLRNGGAMCPVQMRRTSAQPRGAFPGVIGVSMSAEARAVEAKDAAEAKETDWRRRRLHAARRTCSGMVQKLSPPRPVTAWKNQLDLSRDAHEPRSPRRTISPPWRLTACGASFRCISSFSARCRR